jgi:hypothetical protein
MKVSMLRQSRRVPHEVEQRGFEPRQRLRGGLSGGDRSQDGLFVELRSIRCAVPIRVGNELDCERRFKGPPRLAIGRRFKHRQNPIPERDAIILPDSSPQRAKGTRLYDHLETRH